MAITDRDPAELKLWDHQIAAVRAVEKYFHTGSDRACLVHMPTGTGKTGVMAVLATRRAASDPVLVVCPSAALVEQLIKELNADFWDRIGAVAEWRPDEVLQVLPSSVSDLVDKLEGVGGRRVIVVSTIQAMQQIHSAGDDVKLHGSIGTIVFDEGHREPAPLWAKVVRGFAVPTVLFSATPFRGDLKIFNVDDEHIHFLSFQTAVEDSLIRAVEIQESALPDDKATFAAAMITERDALIRDGVFDPDCKMIVRAGTEEDVSELFDAFVAALNGRPDGVLALHNRFGAWGEVGAQRRSDVPDDLKNRPEKFLIHQFMLVEGIDDPACTMLALYEPFTNTRMLVQQIGRLTRQPAGELGQKAANALVFAREGDGVEAQWKTFISYDAACIDNGGRPPLRNGAEVLRKLVDALPQTDYIHGQFRNRVDLDQIDLREDLQFPRAAVVYETDNGFDLETFQSDVSALLDAEDRFEHSKGEAAHGACRVHMSLGLTQSPFLVDALFQAAALEVTIYAHVKKRLYFYDSGGLWIDELKGIGARVSPLELRSLLPDEPDNSISFLAVKNTDLGPTSVRSRTLTARSLGSSGVFMGEHMNVVTRATGRADEIRRSVGFTRSSVRDGEGYTLSAAEFFDWCTDIDTALSAKRQAASLLNRFATPAPIPADTKPVNILVDMQEIADQFGLTDDDGLLDGMCVDIEEDTSPDAPAPYRFTLSVAGESRTVWIKWDAKRKKYWLTSTKLSQIKTKHDAKVSLTRRLNQLQAFRIITADHKHAYVDGSFYTLDLDLADPNGPGRLVLDLVTAIAELRTVTSEKGIPAGESLPTWREGSLFRLIDDALVEAKGPHVFGAAFPALVCDDFGTEAGDFIGVDEGPSSPRIVFVVAKHKKGDDPGVATSAFYDVSSQGLKNLAYIKSDGVLLPGADTKFDADWRLTDKKTQLTDRVARKRAGPGSKAFRKMLARAKSAPRTERTIWLICAGQMLSRKALEDEFKAAQPKAHVLQFYHLVASAFSACQSVGVGLRIFSAP
ncbi:DEAD/DEAH box helicase [Nitratireductor indicus]|uniref:DEAD/DEAH box helicase n=1 Tax=Nitratireductor indicus TaxID=721133 RepID=UPI002874D588|nr:DEAD/DEAH box helicase family protein [Nitratireductor indicus]MDS1138765.1 DEAD/DEAH box helicase family protein [Nitratireductor indicus]